MPDCLGATQITVDEMEKRLPVYLRRVEAGEAFVIVRAGQPLAEIKPIPGPAKSQRPFGLCVGEFVVPDDFDDPLPESTLLAFQGT